MKNAAERTQKKQKRKADESVLQAKREEMGKNKAPPSCLLFVLHADPLKDLRRGQALLLPSGSDRAFQTFCGYQGAVSIGVIFCRHID